jgi:hypothetical protein
MQELLPINSVVATKTQSRLHHCQASSCQSCNETYVGALQAWLLRYCDIYCGQHMDLLVNNLFQEVRWLEEQIKEAENDLRISEYESARKMYSSRIVRLAKEKMELYRYLADPLLALARGADAAGAAGPHQPHGDLQASCKRRRAS